MSAPPGFFDTLHYPNVSGHMGDPSPAAWNHNAEHASLLLVEAAHVVDLGFGFPLQKRMCCDALLALAATRALGNAQQIAHHNASTKRISTMVLSWMDYVRDSTASMHDGTMNGDAGWPSKEDASPGLGAPSSPAATAAPTSLHDVIRNLALGGAEESGLGNFNGGCPYPDVAVTFDGTRVPLSDDWDPLTD